MDWTDRTPPDLDDFAAIAQAAFDRLPAAFRRRVGTVPIRIEDFPDDDVCNDMELETAFDLLGLYQGAGLAASETGDGGHLPDMIFLYRRPILDAWAEGEDTLGAIIAHVLIHEIGHHFCLSDADMEALEAAAEREEGAA